MTETVLIVDDEPFNVEILTEYLDDAGIQSHSVTNGEAACDVLADRPEQFATVLLDRMMPGINGIEVLQSMKQSSALKNIPVIMQTAASTKQDILEGIQQGVYYYLTKPYDKELLLTVVNRALGDWRHHQQLQLEKDDGFSCVNYMTNGTFTIKTIQDSQRLAQFLAKMCPDTDKVMLGLSEVMLNAIEHGNLGIDYEEKSQLMMSGTWQEEVDRRSQLPELCHKFVSVTVEKTAHDIAFIIEDQGAGFIWENYLDIDAQRTLDGHGRGIALANSLSFDSMEYIGKGNKVVCKVSIG